MGNKILVSVFDSERSAFDGLSALKELHRDGDITLYASTVITKDATGTVDVRTMTDEGPVGTLTGAVTGGLVGLLAGPLGAAVGAYVGGLGGAMYDAVHAGVALDFVDQVSASLTSGKAAVIADIDETWITPIDSRLEALGGTTFRRLQDEVADEELIRESDEARAALDTLRAELGRTTGEAKIKVQNAIDEQQRKLEGISDRIGLAIDERTADFHARLATLREQQSKARERQRQRIDARIDELKASHEARKAKLQEARRLAKASVEVAREALVA